MAISKEALLQRGTEHANRYKADVLKGLDKTECPDDKKEFIIERRGRNFKKGFRQGLKVMHHEMWLVVEQFAKTHYMSPSMRDELMEALRIK